MVTVNGEKIKEERERRQLTRAELARELNVRRQAVYAWERGEVKTISTIGRIAEFFKLPPEYFFISE